MRTFSAWCSVSLTVIGTSSRGVPALERPAVGADDGAHVRERVEVAADRDGRYREARDELLDA